MMTDPCYNFITANASQEAAVPHQFVQAEPGVQVNQCFNIIEECRYVMTISSVCVCIPRMCRGGCVTAVTAVTMPGGRGH